MLGVRPAQCAPLLGATGADPSGGGDKRGSDTHQYLAQGCEKSLACCADLCLC